MSDVTEVFTYAIIDKTTNIVVNRAQWDGITEWNPGDEYLLVKLDDPNIGLVGDTYKDGSFTSPTSSPD